MPEPATRAAMRQILITARASRSSQMTSMMTPISRSALHFWWRHAGVLDQVIGVGVAVVVAAAQSAVMVVRSAGITGIRGNFLHQQLYFLWCGIAHHFAFSSTIDVVSVLIEHGLFVSVSGANWMNSDRTRIRSHAGNENIFREAYVRMMQMADDKSVERLEQKVSRSGPARQGSAANAYQRHRLNCVSGINLRRRLVGID